MITLDRLANGDFASGDRRWLFKRWELGWKIYDKQTREVYNADSIILATELVEGIVTESTTQNFGLIG